MDKPVNYNSILIIDDDPALGKSLVGILARAGYQAEWVATGEEGVRRVRESMPEKFISGVLIDVKLPDMNGVQVLRAIKTLYPDIGAIMITGNTDTESAVNALNEGAYAYVQKPYNVDEVKAIIAKLVEKQKLIHENQTLLKTMVTLNAELEKRVTERTGDLQAANLRLAHTIERLQAADAAKSEFISMVSHELRTPLTVIIGFAQTCLNQMEKIDKDTIQHYVEIMHAHGLMLSKLIESILDLSRIREKGMTLNYETFDLKDLIQKVVESVKIIRTGLNFDVRMADASFPVVSDQDRLQQILLNLIGNAIKYSPDRGVIRIDIRADNGVVEASIADQGPGIPPDIHEKIFEPFFRAKDPINIKTPGTGLGLTITKAIVDALGGEIRVDSKVGEGSRFTFTIPREPHVNNKSHD